MNEQVLVFDAEKLTPHLKSFSGGVCADEGKIGPILKDVIGPGATFFVDREQAEQDPSVKQIIPYCVLTSKLGPDTTYFTYKRTKKGGEGRLHDKWSLGVGGHINPCDGVSDTNYRNAFFRELREEVGLELPDMMPEIVGLIYDDSNDVGRVHFGVVHLVPVPDGFVPSCQDPALSSGQFFLGHALRVARDAGAAFENWSNIVIDHVIR